MEVVTAERLAQLVAAAPGPPMVTARTATGEAVPAALLAWGRADTGWMAGIAFVSRAWHGRSVVTMWAAGSSVRPHPGTDYRRVPRVRLVGPVDAWPALPPRYPADTVDG